MWNDDTSTLQREILFFNEEYMKEAWLIGKIDSYSGGLLFTNEEKGGFRVEDNNLS